jgi:hypothetical protein
MTRRQALKSLILGSGVVLSSTSILSALNIAHAASKDGSYTLAFFTPAQASTIERMSHIILPKSDSLPGAEDVPIVPFIDALYAQLMSKMEQDKFLAGLAKAQANFNAQYNKTFAHANHAQLSAYLHAAYKVTPSETQIILNMIEEDTPPAGKEDIYQLYSFLFNLRALTLEGYFQSELVGEKVLAYAPIPGRYDGDWTIDDNTRAWSI